MVRRRIPAAALLTVLALAALPAAGGDKGGKTALPEGAWQLKGAKLTLAFEGKDVLKISPHGQDDFILVVCKYSAAKDGTVKAKITALEGKEKAKAQDVIPVGSEFTFTWKAKDGAATLADVKGDKSEVFKAHLEGDYETRK
jgi:hypothetical protein